MGGSDARRTGGWVATIDEKAVVCGCLQKTSGGGIAGVTMKRLLLFSDVLRMAAHLLCQRETVLTQSDACTLVVAFPTLSDIGQCQTPSARGLDPPSRIMDAEVSAFVLTLVFLLF